MGLLTSRGLPGCRLSSWNLLAVDRTKFASWVDPKTFRGIGDGSDDSDCLAGVQKPQDSAEIVPENSAKKRTY